MGRRWPRSLCVWLLLGVSACRSSVLAADAPPPSGTQMAQSSGGTGGGSGARALPPPSGGQLDAQGRQVAPTIPPSTGTPGVVRPLDPLRVPTPPGANAGTVQGTSGTNEMGGATGAGGTSNPSGTTGTEGATGTGGALGPGIGTMGTGGAATTDTTVSPSATPGAGPSPGVGTDTGANGAGAVLPPTTSGPGAVRPIGPLQVPATGNEPTEPRQGATFVPGYALPPSPSIAAPAPLPAAEAVLPAAAGSRTPPLSDACRRVRVCYAEMSGDLCIDGDTVCQAAMLVPDSVREQGQCEAMLLRVPTLAAEFAQGRSSYDVPDACM